MEPVEIITVESYSRDYQGARLLIDGADVTDRCFRVEMFADGTARAHMFKCDARGNHILTADLKDLEKETVCGRLEIVRPEGS